MLNCCEQILTSVTQVIDSNAFILGPAVAKLESELAEYCAAKYAIGCASGTDALELALLAVNISPGDEVITTPYSFFATVSTIVRAGGTPVFADIDPVSFNICPKSLAAKITDRTKAVVPVHLFGQCADMDAINSICRAKNIAVIEDAAQAIGSEYKGKRAGVLGDIACFSFYPSKNLGGMGDGGFVTTNDDELGAKLRALRVHGSEIKYHHKYIGLNSRLDSIQAAILSVKLPKLDSWAVGRRSNAERYRKLFYESALTDDVTLPAEEKGSFHTYNQFVIRVSADVRDDLRKHLASKEIGTDVYYPISLHEQECFRYLGYNEGDFPESEKASKETIALPIFPELSNEQLGFVVDAFVDFFK